MGSDPRHKLAYPELDGEFVKKCHMQCLHDTCPVYTPVYSNAEIGRYTSIPWSRATNEVLIDCMCARCKKQGSFWTTISEVPRFNTLTYDEFKLVLNQLHNDNEQQQYADRHRGFHTILLTPELTDIMGSCTYRMARCMMHCCRNTERVLYREREIPKD